MLNANLLTALALAATLAWDPNGSWLAGGRTAVPRIAADGSGGAFVAWRDERFSADCYMQHLDLTGQAIAGWTVGGMPAATGPKYEWLDSVVPDQAGGLFVFWQVDHRAEGSGLDEYVQRFGPDGQSHPSWPEYGVGFASRPWDEQFAQACTDGQNGLYVAWEDFQRSAPFDQEQDCMVQRVLANGSVAPGWPDSGRKASSRRIGGQVLRRVISDGLGGVYVIWNDTANTGLYEVYVQRLLSTGDLAPGWPAEGVHVCSVHSHQFLVDAISDGSHGIVLAWDDDRERPPGVDYTVRYGDIYAARLNSDGTHATGWPLEGLPICIHSGVQWYPHLCPDGTGGALMAWTDSRNRWGELFAQRVLGTGEIAPGWPENGVSVSTAPGDGVDQRLASDGMGGAFIGWQDDTYGYAYAQHFMANGTLAPGWAAPGTRLVDDNSNTWGQWQVDLCPDEAGNAIMVWQDGRYNSSGDLEQSLRAQKLVNDGIVPTQLSLRTIEASAERVRIAWWGAGSAQAALTVERSDDGASWLALGLAVSADADQFTYEDFTIEPGRRYAYRLVDAARRVIVVPEWVDVPAAARFALAGARPNPSRGRDLTVGFSLAARGAGSLELLDLAGRRTAWRDIATLAPGNHTVRFAEASGFAPGIYWLRLSQGANRATARVVIVQ